MTARRWFWVLLGGGVLFFPFLIWVLDTPMSALWIYAVPYVTILFAMLAHSRRSSGDDLAGGHPES